MGRAETGIMKHLTRRLDRGAALAALAGVGLLGASVLAGAGVSACSPRGERGNAPKASEQVKPIVGAATPKSANEVNAAPGAMNGQTSNAAGGAGESTKASGGDMSATGKDATGNAANPGWTNLPVDEKGKVTLSEQDWRSRLSPTQYAVLRGKGTDRAYSGTMWKTNEPGEYRCTACGNLLFAGDSKFISDCGWPAFDKAIKGSIEYHEDDTLGMSRVEVTCAKCGGHLGHVFDDGPTATGTRYCINQTSVTFIPKSQVTTTQVPEQEAKTRP